jgi:hypothetical protein
MGKHLDVNKTVEEFVAGIKNEKIEIYNEFSLQHELGFFLRAKLKKEGSGYKVKFERNVFDLFNDDKKLKPFESGEGGKKPKREIDIIVCDETETDLVCAIELKFPRNGAYPKEMRSFIKDIEFAKKLKEAGFKETYVIIFVDDEPFYAEKDKTDEPYKFFRGEVKEKNETVEARERHPNARECVLWEFITEIPKHRIKTNKGKWRETDGKLMYAVIQIK